jgi:hypothetical protein
VGVCGGGLFVEKCWLLDGLGALLGPEKTDPHWGLFSWAGRILLLCGGGCGGVLFFGFCIVDASIFFVFVVLVFSSC